MSWMEATVAISGALAWPVAVLVIILVLKHEFTKEKKE